MSVFNPNIPQPNDDLSDSQPQILSNFQRSNSSFGIDHYEFADLTTNNGKHKKVTWVDQTASIPAAPASNAILAYGLTQSSITMPYYKRDSIATQFPLAPIKAFVTFQVVANALPPQAQVILESFNITSVTRDPSTTYKFKITNAMRTTNYGILYFASSGAMNNQPSYAMTSTSDFSITSAATDGAQVTVIVLEP